MVARFQLLLMLFCGLLFVACSTQTTSPGNPSGSVIPTLSATPTPSGHTVTIETERQFLELMIAHHQEAIDRSKEIQKLTSTPRLLQFSQNVVVSQQKEVDTMKGWFRLWYGNVAIPSASYLPMMEDMNGLDQKSAERAYISGMIGHHTKAISMAKEVKLKHPRAEVIKLADEIILIQSKEVELLSSWSMDYDSQPMQQSTPMYH